MKNRMVLYAGIALIVGLYVYDRNNKTETMIPAIVVDVQSEIAEKGPDNWLITVKIDDDNVVLAPRASRPDIDAGARICVIEVVRQGQPSEYRLAQDTTC